MFCCFFFFKQKTAYEVRISDWSSDVCSSDLDARVDDAGVCVLAEEAMHQATGLGIGDSGFGDAGSEDAGRRSTFANPKSPIPNPGFLAIHRELRALLQHVLAHARDDLPVLRVFQHRPEKRRIGKG